MKLLSKYKVKDSGINFDISLLDRLTIISGESGVGKTLLFKAIERDCILNSNNNFICLNYDDLASGNIEYTLNTAKNRIIVIDNANVILNDLQKILISMDINNQYIIFSHSVNGFKPSVKGIAQLIVEGHEGKLIYPLLGVQK